MRGGAGCFAHGCASFPSGGAGMPVALPHAPFSPQHGPLLAASLQLMDTPSFYAKWIEKDLEPWKGGITRVGGDASIGVQAVALQSAPERLPPGRCVVRRSAMLGHCCFTCLAYISTA